LADRDDPLLAPLADAGEVLLVQMQIRLAHTDELGDAQPGGIEQLDHRAVADAERRRYVRLRDQRVDLFTRQELRQRRPRAWRPQIVSRVAVEPPVDDQEAVEAAHRRDRA